MREIKRERGGWGRDRSTLVHIKRNTIRTRGSNTGARRRNAHHNGARRNEGRKERKKERKKGRTRSTSRSRAEYINFYEERLGFYVRREAGLKSTLDSPVAPK